MKSELTKDSFSNVLFIILGFPDYTKFSKFSTQIIATRNNILPFISNCFLCMVIILV